MKSETEGAVSSVFQILNGHAERSPKNIALCSHDQRPVTYAALRTLVGRAVIKLNQNGIARNDRVAIVLSNGFDLSVTTLAVLCGATAVPLNAALNLGELTQLFPRLNLRCLISDTSADSAALTLARKDNLLVIDRKDLVTPTASSTDSVRNDVLPDRFATSQDLALVLLTSGTSSTPKAVPLRQKHVCLSAFNVAKALTLRQSDRCLNVMPLFHVHGLIGGLLSSIACGGSVICPKEFSCEQFFELTDSFSPTWYTASPAIHRAILDHAESHPTLHAQLPFRFVRSSSSALPPTLARRMERFFRAPILESYGMTEAAHQIASNSLSQERKDNSVGVPIGTVVRVIDESGSSVSAGEVGEVVIRGMNVMEGYASDSCDDRHYFTRGWFRTGDLGYLDEDGYLFLKGRLKDIIDRGGEKVVPLEIEEQLLSHPDVLEAVVFPIPDSRLGENIATAIVVRGGSTVTEGEIQTFVAERLAYFKVPCRVVFRKRLPVGRTGKLRRADLAKALGVLEADGVAGERLEEPTVSLTPFERVIADIWSGILHVKHIGRSTNFFQVGGDSILAAQITAAIKRTFDVGISLVSFMNNPTVAGVVSEVTELIQRSRSRIRRSEVAELTPDPGQVHVPFPLTELQEAYWVGRHQGFELGDVAAQFYAELESCDLELDRLEKAWNRLIRRHDMLRAIIRTEGDQQILKSVPHYGIGTIDLSALSSQKQAAQLNDIREHILRRARRLEEWPLFELRASILDHRRIRLHLAIDGIILDAWSRTILFDELTRLYRQPHIPLEAFDLSFRDYVLAQQAFHRSETYQQSEQYWRGRVRTLPSAPDLPLSQSPGSLPHPGFECRALKLSAEAWSRLKSRARRVGVTSTAMLLTAFAEVLALWSKNSRFTINVPHFGRLPLHREVERILGEFASLILLEVDSSGTARFEERARRIQDQLWQDLDHAHAGGVAFLRERARSQRFTRVGIMPVVFTVGPGAGAGGRSQIESLERLGEVICHVSQTPQVWLDVHVYEERGGLAVYWNAVEGLFPPGMLDDMFDAYRRFLGWLSEDLARYPTAGDALLPRHQRIQRRAVNATKVSLPDQSLHELFKARAESMPDQPAVYTTLKTLTYNELYALAAGVANRLSQMGAGRNDLVAVVMEKGWEQIVGVLGILMSGAAYVPIDPTQPKERVLNLLEHSEARLAVTHSCFDLPVEWPEKVRRLCIDAETPGSQEVSEPVRQQSPDDLAYVMYTSGSTGAPKGVMISHRGIINALLFTNRRFEVGPSDRVLALTSITHDMSVYDICGMLLAGGTIVLPDRGYERDPAHWMELLDAARVTMWNSVPAMMQLLLDYAADRRCTFPDSLRLIFLGGDWIPLSLAQLIQRSWKKAQLVSVGGPTETTLWNIIYPVTSIADDWKSIPYGRPIANTRYYVLDDKLQERPTWVPGCLYCAGVGLSMGYWRDEAQTRQSFITHPRTGERLYRTGDIGRYLPDGNIEFLGREDSQVKINGYRIEVGEIEATLSQHPGVKAAVVDAQREGRVAQRLVAYVVFEPPNEVSVGELRSFLQRKLPAYMIPSIFRTIDELPLSDRGKIDRRTLPGPERLDDHHTEPMREPDTQVRAKIGRLVASVLNLNRLDSHANLLELGATSIDMIRIVNIIDKEFGFRPQIEDFYSVPTVEGLADGFEAEKRNKTSASGDSRDRFADLRAMCTEVLLDPVEREAFRRGQPGLRRIEMNNPKIQLSGSPMQHDRIVRYSDRRSYRRFDVEPIPFAQFNALLNPLRQWEVQGEPKYLYPSGGGLYPVQVYLYAKPGRIHGIPAGTYYYHPREHCLIPLTLGVELDARAYSLLINRPIFDAAAFAIFLIVQLDAIEPMYGDDSLHFATLEAGYLSQLLMMVAPGFQIGLCPVGRLEFGRIADLFLLDERHRPLHSLLGGRIPRSDPESDHLQECDWEEGDL